MVRKALYERLERLERKIPQPADQTERETEREGWTESLLRHFRVWAVGGKLEEVPAEIRDAEMWAHAEQYGPGFLGLVWEGILEGREEFIAAGIDFTLAEECCDIVGGRLHPPPRSQS